LNTFVFEFKSQVKSFIIWAISILLAYAIFIGAVYPAFSSDLDTVTKVISSYPKPFMELFGFQIENLFSYSGFFSFAFTYMSLIGAIMASITAVSIFSREKRAGCMDFILTKPASRYKIMNAKLLTGILILLVTNVLFVGMATLMYIQKGDGKVSTTTFVLAACALFFTQLMFFSFGMAYAIYAKRVRSVSGIATAIGFGAFILTALSNLIDNDAARYMAVLKYFDPYDVFTNGGFQIKFVLTAIIITALCVVLAYDRYCRSDVRAV